MQLGRGPDDDRRPKAYDAHADDDDDDGGSGGDVQSQQEPHLGTEPVARREGGRRRWSVVVRQYATADATNAGPDKQ